MKINTLGFEVTRPTQELLIMRGVPGSGKSTKSKELVGEGMIFSTDSLIEEGYIYEDFFKIMRETENPGMHTKMHRRNLNLSKKAMIEGVSPVIIDNMNLNPKESKPYVKFAMENGFDDDNIKLINVGTAGLTAKELANRNSHGLTEDKLEKLINRNRTFKDITLEDILNAKDDVLYTSVLLDEKSRDTIITMFGYKIPDNWDVINHHMTITFGKGLPEHLKDDLGSKVSLKIETIGMSDMAMALGVSGYYSDNKIPHITIAVNNEGGKPVMSNNIDNWIRLSLPFELTGIVTEHI